MAQPLYRAWQFLAALRARKLSREELKHVSQYLPPMGLALFQSMPTADQRHSLTILQALRAQGYADRPLLQAALLHDVAKAKVGLACRTAVILLNAVDKKLVPRLASPNPRSWRYPFYLSCRHPELGAEAAARAGLDPQAVTLIRRHQSPPDEQESELARWQLALKALDDRN